MFEESRAANPVDVATEGTPGVGAPRTLFTNVEYSASYDVLPEDGGFVMLQRDGPVGGAKLNVILNFFEKLKVRVPN
jgi:hypothetical protein